MGRVWGQWNKTGLGKNVLKLIVWGRVFLIFIETWQIQPLIEYKEATDQKAL